MLFYSKVHDFLKLRFNKKLSETIGVIDFFDLIYSVSLTMIKKSNLPSFVDIVVEHRKIPTNVFDQVTIIPEAINIESELQK